MCVDVMYLTNPRIASVLPDPPSTATITWCPLCVLWEFVCMCVNIDINIDI